MNHAAKQHLDNGLQQAVDNLELFDKNLSDDDSLTAIAIQMIKMGIVNELMFESVQTFFTGQIQSNDINKALEIGAGLRYFNENHIKDMDDELGAVFEQEIDGGGLKVGAVKSLLRAAVAGDRDARAGLSLSYVQYTLFSKALEVWFAGGLMGKSKKEALTLLSPEVTPPPSVEDFNDVFTAIFEPMGSFREKAGY